MDLREFKDAFRNICTDTWDDALDAWFECVGNLYDRGVKLPDKWKYQPSLIGINVEEDSRFHDDFKESSTPELETIGNFLTKYLELLDLKGLRPEEE